jgi:hypothetical protein
MSFQLVPDHWWACTIVVFSGTQKIDRETRQNVRGGREEEEEEEEEKEEEE